MRPLNIVGCVALAAGAAWARPEIPYANLSGSATTITFDSLAGNPSLGAGEVLGNQYAGQGVTFSVPNFNAYASTSIAAISTLQSDPNVIWIDQGGGSSPNGLGINVDFAVPVHRAGAWVGGSTPGTFTIRAYDGATLLEEVTHALSPAPLGQEGFLAIERPEVITRIVFYSTNSSATNWNFSIDDLKFESAAACYPNCDHSTVAPILNVQDFTCFLNSFANAETYANCDGSTIPPVLNVQDFSCFLNRFAIGCS